MFPQSVGKPEYKGRPWETVTVGVSDSNESKALQIGN